MPVPDEHKRSFKVTRIKSQSASAIRTSEKLSTKVIHVDLLK